MDTGHVNELHFHITSASDPVSTSAAPRIAQQALAFANVTTDWWASPYWLFLALHEMTKKKMKLTKHGKHITKLSRCSNPRFYCTTDHIHCTTLRKKLSICLALGLTKAVLGIPASLPPKLNDNWVRPGADVSWGPSATSAMKQKWFRQETAHILVSFPRSKSEVLGGMWWMTRVNRLKNTIKTLSTTT